MKKSHTQAVVDNEIKKAKNVLGHGWNHVSDEIRWGLVCANLMSVVCGQAALDDDGDDEAKARVAEYAREMYQYAYSVMHPEGI